MTDTYAPPPDFAPRLRFGPSILDKAEQCPRAYALQYLCGYDTQEPLWAEIADHTYDTDRRVYVAPAGYVGPWETLPSRKRSTALGTECHARVEAYYGGTDGAVNWLDFPGQIAQAWLDVMPRPHECDEVFTELPIRLWPLNYPDLVLEGTSDLLLKVRNSVLSDLNRFLPAWAAHLLNADGYLVADWKTTRDWRYQKKAAELYTNRQGVIYPLAAMRKLDLDTVPARWAYSITDPKKRREARATDFVQTREHAEARVAEYFVEAHALREKGVRFLALRDGGGAGPIAEQRLEFVKAEFTANTNACDDYGGCPHSYERGGACTAKRTLGSRIMAAGNGTCAPAVVPLESLLRKSLDNTRGENQMSPWALKAQQARNTLKSGTPAAPEQAPPIDPAAGLFVNNDTGTSRLMTEPEIRRASAAVADPFGFALLSAEARASVALDGETRSVEAGDSTGLEPAGADETTSVETPAPRKRGRPAGSRNKGGALLSREAAAELLNTPLEPGVSSAIAMKTLEALADEGVDDALDALGREAQDRGDYTTTFDLDKIPPLTLEQVAAAAKSLGCEITLYFPAQVKAGAP